MAKLERKKYGLVGSPLPATRVLVMDMEYFLTQTPKVVAKALLVIDDVAGTITSAQIYDGNLGRNYSTANLVKPLPDSTSSKWKEWKKKGYEFGKVGDYDVLTSVLLPEVGATSTLKTPVSQPVLTK